MHWYATLCKGIVAVVIDVRNIGDARWAELYSWYATALALNSPLWTAHAEADVRST